MVCFRIVLPLDVKDLRTPEGRVKNAEAADAIAPDGMHEAHFPGRHPGTDTEADRIDALARSDIHRQNRQGQNDKDRALNNTLHALVTELGKVHEHQDQKGDKSSGISDPGAFGKSSVVTK